MFNDNQIKTLEQELASSRIKTREKGNITLSYLEGFDIIDTANRIFGFGNWEYTISKIEQVSQETNQNQNIVVCYKAIVKTIIHDINHSKQVSREDIGFGKGIAKTLAEAHEGAAKEAVTDGLKRSLKSFGNQLGLSLYNKSKNHNTVNSNANIQSPTSNLDTKTQSPNNYSSNNFDQYEYQSLYNLGLNIVEQNGFLLITGNEIFANKDSIKACGFRWDGKTKQWYKVLNEQGAA